MNLDFFNIKDIFCEHFKIVKKSGNIVLFYVIPIILGITSLFIDASGNNINSILSTTLAIFIGLFMNLLVLIVSVVSKNISENKLKDRTDLVKEMFYNISYVITISILSLILLIIKDVKFSFLGEYSQVYRASVSFIFIILFTNVLITLVMIIKRIFRLFNFDIKEFEKKIKKE